MAINRHRDLSASKDETLLALYLQGDNQAFSLLYTRHKGGLYRYFLRQCQSQAQAEDMYQDTWSQVISKADSFRQQSQFNTWLYRIAHNKLVDQMRHLQVVEQVIEQGSEAPEDAAGNGQIDDWLNSKIAAEAIQGCVAKLPQAQKDSFLLKEEGGLSVAQIAEVVGANLEACKSRLRYAVQALRQCLQLKLGAEGT